MKYTVCYHDRMWFSKIASQSPGDFGNKRIFNIRLLSTEIHKTQQSKTENPELGH